MANALFATAKKKFLDADIDMLVDNIKVVLVDHGTDTPVPATDEFLSDIAAGARVVTSGNLAGKSTTGGVFDADDLTGLTVTATCESAVIYKDSGDPATSPLIAFIDTATGLPTAASGDVDITWDSGANKIFAL